MDIAAFVGFAASGPLHTPVAIESEAQFTAIYGDDARLSWDLEKGEQLYAHLAPAVLSAWRGHLDDDSVKQLGPATGGELPEFFGGQ